MDDAIQKQGEEKSQAILKHWKRNQRIEGFLRNVLTAIVVLGAIVLFDCAVSLGSYLSAKYFPAVVSPKGK